MVQITKKALFLTKHGLITLIKWTKTIYKILLLGVFHCIHYSYVIMLRHKYWELRKWRIYHPPACNTMYISWSLLFLTNLQPSSVVGSRWRQQVSPKWYFSTRLYCISPYKTVFITTRTSSLTILMNGNTKLLLLHFLSCTFMIYSIPQSHPKEPWNAKELYGCKLKIEHQSCHGEFLQISSLWSSSSIISLWSV